jgi:hypothetical protein
LVDENGMIALIDFGNARLLKTQVDHEKGTV